MDSVTHAVLGGCIGEAITGKKLGFRAIIWGALAQSIPDIDFIASFWMDTASNLLAHRGFTHSIIFGAAATMFMALIAERWHRPHNISFSRWLVFFGIEIFVHLFIDTMNAYGTGLLEPFSHERFSFNVIFVADPLFSVGPGIAFVALLILKLKSPKRSFWWRFGVTTASVYLAYCLINKSIIDYATKRSLTIQGISVQKYFTTPTALNNWLWYIVARDSSGFHIGYRSVFDKKKETEFYYFKRNDGLIERVDDHENLQKLIRFSQGFYTIENQKDKLIFNDLRFGQIAGWHEPSAPFTFHYFLQHPSENKLIVQRGRFAGWDKEAVASMVDRIKGR